MVLGYLDRNSLKADNNSLRERMDIIEATYNDHIDNTIVYLENVIGTLKRLKFPGLNRPPVVYNHIM